MGWGAAVKTRSSYFCDYCLHTTPFYALMFYCPGFSVGYSKKKPPEEGMGAGASLVRSDLPSVEFSLFRAGEGGAEHCSLDGCCRVGWSEQVPSTKVSARDNCLLANTIISANKNCLHSHKQIILGPGWLSCFYYGNYFS